MHQYLGGHVFVDDWLKLDVLEHCPSNVPTRANDQTASSAGYSSLILVAHWAEKEELEAHLGGQ